MAVLKCPQVAAFQPPGDVKAAENKLIARSGQLVAAANRPADLRELYRRLPSMEIYAKVLEANFPLQDGTRRVIGSSEVLKIQNATLPSGHSLAQFFVDRTDLRLQPNYVGMTPREACQMTLKIDGLAGLMLCNPSNSWVALLKPELERLLQKELASLGAASNAGPPHR